MCTRCGECGGKRSSEMFAGITRWMGAGTSGVEEGGVRQSVVQDRGELSCGLKDAGDSEHAARILPRIAELDPLTLPSFDS